MVKNTNAKTWLNLAQVVQAQYRLDEAIHYYKNVLQIVPEHVSTLKTIGDLLLERGDDAQAAQYYRQVVSINPGLSSVYNNLGLVMQKLGDKQQAIEHFRRAVETTPTFHQAWNNLGIACLKTGDMKNALKSFEKATEINPSYAEAHYNLARFYCSEPSLDIARALSCYRKGVACDPSPPGQHSEMLFMLQYGTGYSHEEIYSEHTSWGDEVIRQVHGESLPPLQNTIEPSRQLKVGFVSPDLKAHAVACFFEGVLQFLPGKELEIFCYSETHPGDAVTHRMQLLANHWVPTAGMSDFSLASRIRADAIDILVDLAGHSGKNRLRVFARKPAPIQATWIGYCNTSGLRVMDYLLADEITIPRNTHQQFTERIFHLPQSYLCFRPLEDAPEICSPPCLSNGHITFGSFNNLMKLTPLTIEIWANLLRQLPKAKLVIKVRNLPDEQQTRIRTKFASQGALPEQIEFICGNLTNRDLFAHYHNIDIALDTFPYNGVTTTCEALWMGVPVITLTGDTFISRNAASILHNLGLTELVARTPQEYIEIALGLVQDTQRLVKLRQGMRNRFADSPLGNPPLFAHNLAQAFRGMWQEWCNPKAGGRDRPQVSDRL